MMEKLQTYSTIFEQLERMEGSLRHLDNELDKFRAWRPLYVHEHSSPTAARYAGLLFEASQRIADETQKIRVLLKFVLHVANKASVIAGCTLSS